MPVAVVPTGLSCRSLMKVSLLIGSRNRPDVLNRCLQSALAQDHTPLEILVLDDASDQLRLDELIAAKFQDRRLCCFRTERSLGVAGGRNFLMQQATGDVFCVIDDDAYFADSRCVKRMVEAFESYPGVGILATRVIDHRSGEIGLLVPFSQAWLNKRPNLTTEAQLVSYYLGTCHAIRRRVVEACGGYQNDSMFGEEELDLSYRAISSGFQIMYFPYVTVHHHPQPSVIGGGSKNNPSELYYHIRNRFFLSYKYLPVVYIPVYLAVWITIYGLRAVKLNALKEFLLGIVAGVKLLTQLERTPLNSQAVHYLKTHYGRLWY